MFYDNAPSKYTPVRSTDSHDDIAENIKNLVNEKVNGNIVLVFFSTKRHCIISYVVILSLVLVREIYLHNMAIIYFCIVTIISS